MFEFNHSFSQVVFIVENRECPQRGLEHLVVISVLFVLYRKFWFNIFLDRSEPRLIVVTST